MSEPATITEEPRNALAEQAARLVEANRVPEAAAVYEQILRQDPADRDALNFFGTQALAAGDTQRSLDFFQRALAVHADDAALHKNLGLALRRAGRFDEALAALDAALRLKPEYPMVYLHRGALLEHMGKSDDAIGDYLAALTQAEKVGIIAQHESLPAGLRQGLQHAMNAVQAARAEYLARVLQPLRKAHGNEALQRVDHTLRVYLGQEPRPAGDPRQRCTFMTFQGIPAQGWFERAQFPWFRELEQHSDEIRAELLGVLGGDEGFRPFIEMPKEHPGAKYWESLNYSPNWNAFFFYRDGHRFDDNCRRCPVTAELLDRLPLSRVADHSPETFFSVLRPGAHIPVHTGVINSRLVAHLPLIIPPDVGIRVNGEIRVWKPGECIVFDDTFEHEAWNYSDQTRVVLIFDVWNPYLTELECEAMRLVVEQLGCFNRAHGQSSQVYEAR